MSKILALIDRLPYTGHGRLLRDLALELMHGGRQIRLLVLEGSAGAWGETLQRAGIEVTCLHWHWPLDIKPWRTIRHVLAEWKPHLVHAWGRHSMRWLSLSGWQGRRIATLPFSLATPGWAQQLDRRLCRSFERVVVLSSVEQQRALARGWPGDRLTVIPPGMAEPVDSVAAAHPAFAAAAPVVVAVGALVAAQGMSDALWAIDILRYVYPDIRLVIVGDGPERMRLEQYAANNSGAGVVHFVGNQDNLAPWLTRAVALWCPIRQESSSDLIVTALACGCPVIAPDFPLLAERLLHGAAGQRITPRDRVQLGEATRRFLDNPAERVQTQAAGRQLLREHYSLTACVAAWQRLYA